MHVTRRTALLAGLWPLGVSAAETLSELERRAGGRLGVALLDTGSGRRWGHRSDERFGMCSTFKLPLVGAVLQAVERGRLQADARLPLRSSDRVPHMPVTEGWLARGWATPLALAEATQVTSDNLAANVLLRALGGPESFTAWLRGEGDRVTRLDRLEPELNHVLGADERDTTSPAALAAVSAKLCFGRSLTPLSRARLVGWMEATATGQRRLRAGLPGGWRAGDKTGTGLHDGMPDRINDVAVFWPPERKPWVLACLYEGPLQGSPSVRPQDEAVLAEVGRMAAAYAVSA